MWYNILPLCKDGAFNRDACPIPMARAMALLNHTNPLATRMPNVKWKEHGEYGYARQCARTTTIHEYANDLHHLLQAVKPWRQAAPLLWLEATPQHFMPNTTTQVIDQCSEQPGTFVSSYTSWKKAPLPPEAVALCGKSPGQTLTMEDCALGAPLADWRNAVASPVLQRARVPVVPQAAALRASSSLHKGIVRQVLLGPDCTHWCDASLPSLHIITMTLNAVAAALKGTFDFED